MSGIRPLNYLAGSPLNHLSLTTPMIDIAPGLNPAFFAVASRPGTETGAGSGMARLFGRACDALAVFFGVGPKLQPAAVAIGSRGMATLPEDLDRPSIILMEGRKHARGRRAAHAALNRYRTMPLRELEGLVEKQRSAMQSELKTWADDIITNLGQDLWKGEKLPSVEKAGTVEFWKDVLTRVDRVFQMTSQRIDEQSSIAKMVVDNQTSAMVGISTDAFREAVTERMEKGGEFLALLDVHAEVSEVYFSTLQPEIERRQL